MLRLFLITFFSFISCYSFGGEVVRIALPSEGNPPYFNGDPINPAGLYVEFFDRLFSYTDLKHEYVYLSTSRIRNSFITNEIDIECCPLKAWRADEEGISVYTSPVFKTKDILVYPQGEKEQVTSLDGQNVATVAGYGYLDQKQFNRVDLNSELAILRIVEGGRVEVGIVDAWIAYHLIEKHSLKVNVGRVYESANRLVRVHKNAEAIVPKLNLAIVEMNKKGELERLFNSPQL